MVEVCAYAGTGNVLKVQQLLHICSEHFDSPDKEDSKKDDRKDKKEDKKDDLSSRQAIAVLGIALIAMGEEIGSEMAFRTFGHLVSFLFI